MQEPILLGFGLIAIAIVLAMLIYMFGRLKLEQQKTVQMLLEKDPETRAEWAQLLGPRHRAEADFRRGLLLLITGLTLLAFLYYAGGIAWMLSFIPITVGLVYLYFWKRNDGKA